jgi:hypothetical protein
MSGYGQMFIPESGKKYYIKLRQHQPLAQVEKTST